MEVISLAKYRSRDVVETLEGLLAAARDGEVRGLVFVVKVAPGDNRAGVAGTYKKRPAEALQATFQLERMLAESSPFVDSI